MPITPASVAALAEWRRQHRAAGIRLWKRPDNAVRQNFWLQPRLDNAHLRQASAVDIAWLAGLLEGEGCFFTRSSRNDKRTVLVQLGMTDRDIVERAAKLIGGTVREQKDKRPTHKPNFVTYRSGPGAIEVMLLIYSHLGERRRAKIDEILRVWERVG